MALGKVDSATTKVRAAIKSRVTIAVDVNVTVMLQERCWFLSSNRHLKVQSYICLESNDCSMTYHS